MGHIQTLYTHFNGRISWTSLQMKKEESKNMKWQFILNEKKHRDWDPPSSILQHQDDSLKPCSFSHSITSLVVVHSTLLYGVDRVSSPPINPANPKPLFGVTQNHSLDPTETKKPVTLWGKKHVLLKKSNLWNRNLFQYDNVRVFTWCWPVNQERRIIHPRNQIVLDKFCLLIVSKQLTLVSKHEQTFLFFLAWSLRKIVGVNPPSSTHFLNKIFFDKNMHHFFQYGVLLN